MKRRVLASKSHENIDKTLTVHLLLNDEQEGDGLSTSFWTEFRRWSVAEGAAPHMRGGEKYFQAAWKEIRTFWLQKLEQCLSKPRDERYGFSCWTWWMSFQCIGLYWVSCFPVHDLFKINRYTSLQCHAVVIQLNTRLNMIRHVQMVDILKIIYPRSLCH